MKLQIRFEDAAFSVKSAQAGLKKLVLCLNGVISVLSALVFWLTFCVEMLDETFVPEAKPDSPPKTPKLTLSSIKHKGKKQTYTYSRLIFILFLLLNKLLTLVKQFHLRAGNENDVYSDPSFGRASQDESKTPESVEKRSAVEVMSCFVLFFSVVVCLVARTGVEIFVLFCR